MTRREILAGAAALPAAAAPQKSARVRRADVTLEQAQAVHRRMLIVDGHNDVPVERIHRGEKPLQWKRRDTSYHTDIPRMKEAGYDSAFFIVGNGPTANLWVTIEHVLRQVAEHPEDLLLALSARDVVRASESGKTAILMAIEGAGRWLDAKVELLGILHRLGVRSVALTHGEGGTQPGLLQGSRSPYGPCTPADRERERKEAGGLTAFGKEVMRANTALNIITDLAHINDKAYFEALELASKPPIVSHTAVFSQCHHWRCLTDDQIKALASAGGVMGVAFAPSFIHADPQQATVDRVVEHICYAADLVGIDHVGIGSDFDGLGKTVPVVPEVSQLVRLTRAMMARGMREDEMRKVWGGNFLRVLEKNG
jgi:membrane dipeptidase